MPPRKRRRLLPNGDDTPANWTIVAFLSPMGLLLIVILVAGVTGLIVQASPKEAGIVELKVAVGSQLAAGTQRHAIFRRSSASDVDVRALLADAAIRNFKGLAEYSWDFNDPSGMAGFGPMSTPRNLSVVSTPSTN